MESRRGWEISRDGSFYSPCPSPLPSRDPERAGWGEAESGTPKEKSLLLMTSTQARARSERKPYDFTSIQHIVLPEREGVRPRGRRGADSVVSIRRR